MGFLLPVLFTLFVWWFSTGAIMFLNGLPRRTHAWSFAGSTVVLGAGLLGISASAGDTSVAGAYCAFTCGLLVWAWHEVSLLLGFVTGPRVTASPAGCSAWQHLWYAIQAILYHEVMLLLMLVVVVGLTWNAANQVAASTFLILWTMRLSAKLNLFLGVRNVGAGFLPEHLEYLQTYFTRRRMNLLFPLSISVTTLVATILWREACAAGISPFERTGLVFAASLLSLALLEHWFMVLPLNSAALWNWGLRSREWLRGA